MQPQKPASGAAGAACPARLHQHQNISVNVRRTQSAAAFTSISSKSKNSSQLLLGDAKAGRPKAIPRPSSHVIQRPSSLMLRGSSRGTSGLGGVVGSDIASMRLPGVSLGSSTGSAKSSSTTRPGSAYLKRQQRTPDDGPGGIKRRPAHIQAIEWERVRSRPGGGAGAGGGGEAKKSREQAQALKRCRQVSEELRDAILSTSQRVDFIVLEKAAACRGDECLAALCDCLGKLASHVFSFFNVALASQPDLHPSGLEVALGIDSNVMRCKSFLVLLRSYGSKLPCSSVRPNDAVELCKVLEAGLVEQTLSWCSETISCYSVVYQTFQVPSRHSRPPLASGSGSGSFRRRIANSITAVAELESARDRKGSLTPRGSPSPPIQAPIQNVDREIERCIKNKSKRGNSERMQKFRPPNLVIPETSFERKSKRGK